MPIGTTLLERTLTGNSERRPPAWIMRQAGRYLPEYRELRTRIGFQEATRTPDVATRITLQPIERFELDAAILFSDIATPLEGMGVSLTYQPGPVMDTPIRSRAQLDALRVLDPQEGVPFVLETLGLVRAELPEEVALIGFAGAPWTLFCYLVQGSGSKDFATARSLVYQDPALTQALLEHLADSMATYLIAQSKAGADVLMLFDSWAGLLSPTLFRSVVGPVVSRVLEQVRAATSAPLIYFPRGAASYLDQVGDLGANAIGIDWTLPLSEASARLGGGTVVQGNLDPAAMFAGEDRLRLEVRRVLEEGANAPGHVFNLGHGIDRHTDPSQVNVVLDEVRSWSAQRGE